MPGREVLITSGCKSQWGLWLGRMEGFWSPRHPSQRAHTWTYSVLLALSFSTGQQLEGMRGTWGGPELFCIQTKAGVVASSLTEVLPKVIVPFLSLANRVAPYLSLPQPGLHCLPHPCDFLRASPHPTCEPAQTIFSGFSIQMTSLGSCFGLSQNFLNK